jgi:methylmalonyl-CoA mutase C-terminal domain/subunit
VNIKQESILLKKGRHKLKRKARVLIAKVGLDGHDVGARVVARALADAGMEVVYTGLRQTPEQVANAAVQEGVDLIGISILSGSHMAMFPEIFRFLKELEAEDIPIIAGGIIPVEDIKELKKIGVKEVFLPEESLSNIINCVSKITETNIPNNNK